MKRTALAFCIAAAVVAGSLFLPVDPLAEYILAPGAVVSFSLFSGRTHDLEFLWTAIGVNLLTYGALLSVVLRLIQRRDRRLDQPVGRRGAA
jgi:hypothetical protein